MRIPVHLCIARWRPELAAKPSARRLAAQEQAQHSCRKLANVKTAKFCMGVSSSETFAVRSLQRAGGLCAGAQRRAAAGGTQANGRSSSTATFPRSGTYALVCGVDSHCHLGQYQVYTVS